MRIVDNALMFSAGSLTVTDSWHTVRTANRYAPGAMVVVATPISDDESNLVAVVGNIGTDTFEVRLLSVDGDTPVSGSVSWFAVNSGRHDYGTHRIEAVRIPVEAVDVPGAEQGQSYASELRFEQPVVLGQVVDPSQGDKWLAFWASGPQPGDAPSAAAVRVGRHAGRSNPGGFPPGELCVVIFESGLYGINGVEFEAQLVERLFGVRPLDSGVAPMLAGASIASVGSQDGAWPVIRGGSVADAFNNESVEVALTSVRGGDGVKGEGQPVALLTVNGQRDAARFAKQAAWGGHDNDLRAVFQAGYGSWIDSQRDEPISAVLPYMEFLAHDPFGTIPEETRPAVLASAAGHNRWDQHLNLTTPWLRNVVWEPDQLRQRITFCLSQIFVVSGNQNELSVAGAALAEYYDGLATHALGNFRDLLSQVTYNGVMASYLTYVANRPPSADGTRQPDENYAREIMQLMTIGLWELNLDGSLVVDPEREGPEFVQRDGETGVPTYSNVEINTLARVFTGLFHDAQIGGAQAPYGTSRTGNGQDDSIANSYLWSGLNINQGVEFDRSPLAMFEAEHDHGAKVLFGATIPATQWDGVADIPEFTITSIPADRMAIADGGLAQVEAALDILFAHPNVGPFIGRRLIQSLVTSNPSPGYVQRVAEIFNDDGAGVRGDLHAVVRAILLDPEARGYFDEDPSRGKLVEPLVKVASLAKGFRLGAQQTRVFDAVEAPVYARGYLQGLLEQGLLRSPSVFNFFAPDFEIAPDLLAPEAQILNARSIPALERVLDELMFDGLLPAKRNNWIRGDYTAEIQLLENGGDASLDRLIDALDTRVCHGQLSPLARSAIRSAVHLVREDPNATPLDQLRVAVISAAISPDASVLV